MRSARQRRIGASTSGDAALVDAFMEVYLLWRERAAELDARYRRWSIAGSAADRRVAFAEYRRALDDEECAARCFAEFALYATRSLAA